jgi:tetratricopeptide (TPR) repeat protein
MHKSRLAALCGAAAILMSSAPSKAADPKPGSVYVQCDGKPDNVSAAETAARVIALAAVVGLLAPPQERPDASKRLEGAAGIKACDSALADESNAVRKVELTLARAIHQIEAGNHEAAIADARRAADVAQPLAADRYYQRSLGLSVLEVEAAALMKAGRFSEAERVALRMADAAPYDIVNHMRARLYLGTTDDHPAETAKFMDRITRLHTDVLRDRAGAHEWRGEYRQAAADYEALLDIHEGTKLLDGQPDPRPFWNGRRAIAYMLAGEIARGNQLAEESRRGNELAAASGTILAAATNITLTDEVLEFHRVMQLMAEGKLDEARRRLKARPRWLAPTTGAFSDVVARLRAGAKASDLEGPLAHGREKIRADFLEQVRTGKLEDKKLPERLFAGMRPLMKSNEFTSGASSVWRTRKSRYLVPKKGKMADYPFEIIVAHDVYGIASSYAVLMHAALLARDRGKEGFVLLPTRKQTDTIAVMIGNPGDPGVPASVMLNAEQTIEALKADFPQPQKK